MLPLLNYICRAAISIGAIAILVNFAFSVEPMKIFIRESVKAKSIRAGIAAYQTDAKNRTMLRISNIIIWSSLATGIAAAWGIVAIEAIK